MIRFRVVGSVRTLRVDDGRPHMWRVGWEMYHDFGPHGTKPICVFPVFEGREKCRAVARSLVNIWTEIAERTGRTDAYRYECPEYLPRGDRWQVRQSVIRRQSTFCVGVSTN